MNRIYRMGKGNVITQRRQRQGGLKAASRERLALGPALFPKEREIAADRFYRCSSKKAAGLT